MEAYRSGHNGLDSKSSNPVKGTVGSNPTASATSEQAISSLLRFFFGKIGVHSRRCSSFSAKGHVRAACCCVRPLGASALTTARCRRQILAGASTARGISLCKPLRGFRCGGAVEHARQPWRFCCTHSFSPNSKNEWKPGCNLNESVRITAVFFYTKALFMGFFDVLGGRQPDSVAANA